MKKLWILLLLLLAQYILTYEVSYFHIGSSCIQALMAQPQGPRPEWGLFPLGNGCSRTERFFTLKWAPSPIMRYLPTAEWLPTYSVICHVGFGIWREVERAENGIYTTRDGQHDLLAICSECRIGCTLSCHNPPPRLRELAPKPTASSRIPTSYLDR